MQPIVIVDGVARFKANGVVKKLLEEGSLDLNRIGLWKDVSIEDKEQFWQMLGYSVDGFADLSWPRQETKDAADAEVARLFGDLRGGR